ncbi:MAG: DUF2341 domain-containing protein, partial [Fibrobacteria bacterium]|nr:DUF2341 domain-containing protein [Fibrobacteria bacterium]
MINAADYSAWSNSKKVYINTKRLCADVNGNVLNFPLLIRLHAGNFDFSEADSNGSDMRFNKSDGVTTLNYEIARWNQDSSLAEIWVKVDTVLGNNSSQYVIMYWGKSDATSESDGAAVFETSNKFAGVWHLEEEGDTIPDGFKDETTNAFHAKGVGLDSNTDVEAVIGKGQQFAADYLELPDVITQPGWTFSAWVKKDAATVDAIYGFGPKTGTNPSVTVLYTSATGNLPIISVSGGGTATAVTAISPGTWFHITATQDPDYNYRLFVNGVAEAGPVDVRGAMTLAEGNETIGANWASGAIANYFNGIIDEPRISTSARSFDWIKLSYATQRPDQRAVSFGDVLGDWQYNRDMTLNTTSSGADITSDLYSFPVLVRLTSENFSFSEAKTNGEDIRFTKSDGTFLFHEIERWDNSVSRAEIWVKVDTVFGDNNSQL